MKTFGTFIPAGSSDQRNAFALVDLLFFLLVIAILVGLLLPAMAKSKTKAQGIGCMNNHKQLALAWILYADDSKGKLPAAASWRPPGARADLPDWCGGSVLTLNDPKDPNNWDHEKFTRKSVLSPYTGNSFAIWKCPADESSAIDPQGRRAPRIRSVSMNCWVGGPGFTEPWTPKNPSGWRVNLKVTDINDPGPAMTFIFLDEREDSIDDGRFEVDMSGYPDKPDSMSMIDVPAAYHNGAGGFAFADGHSEIKKWRDARTMPPSSKQDLRSLGAKKRPSPNNSDILWLQERSTRMSSAP